MLGRVMLVSGAVLLVCPLLAEAQTAPLDPSAQRGRTLLQADCASCHAVGAIGDSPLKVAPPFRTLHQKYPVESLQGPLSEGIITGHPTMPQFRFDPGQVKDIITYLKTLK